MVTPWVEVGLGTDVPLPAVERRHAALGTAAAGVLLPAGIEVGAAVAAGVVHPTESEWLDEDLGIGWEIAPGVRAGVRLPVGRVLARPSLGAALVWREHTTWEPERVTRRGAALSAGVDLLLPASAATWAHAGLHAGLDVRDGAPFVQARIGVGLGAPSR